MAPKAALAVVLIGVVAACTQAPREAPGQGSRHTHRFKQPPEKAAQCFARNAEAHSSALVSEVRRSPDGGAEVSVRVKNGVPYASAELRPARTGATGRITLMVTSSARRSELLDALVEGC